jgi:hypothetical protein
LLWSGEIVGADIHLCFVLRRSANPIVDAAFDRAVNTQPDLLMVSVFVDRESYKNAEVAHPLRTDPELRLTAVPTLFKYVNGECIARLVENDCTSPVLLEQFLRKDGQLP